MTGAQFRIIRAASHALRSYQYGNASTELAKSVADACDAALNEGSQMKPSIGRIVFFRSENSNGVLEHPAIVTRVWSDETVNLTVFLDAGVPVSKTSVTLNESMTEGNQSFAWRWPPRV